MTNPRLPKILYTGADPSGEVDARQLTPLVHVHVPKCAGTTLDHVLMGVASACGRPGLRFPGTIYGQGFAGVEKGEAWRDAEGFRYPEGWLYASGHIPYGCFPEYGAGVHRVSIIRDPLSRLISMYRMGVRRKAWRAATPVANLFESGLFAPDSMVRQLCGERSRDRVLGEKDVETALRNFQGMTYAGRIEDFDAVLGAILAAYKIPYVAYHSFQVGESAPETADEALAEAFAPFMALDRLFFDRAAAGSIGASQTREVCLSDVAPSAPILLVSPYLTSGSGRQVTSAFVTAQRISELLGP